MSLYNNEMKLKLEEIVNLKKEEIKEDCTVSKILFNNNDSIIMFKNSKDTEISEESYDYLKLYYIIKGESQFILNKNRLDLKENDVILVNKNSLIGVNTIKDTIYLEFNLIGDINMNKKIVENVFNVKDLIDYEEGSIVNLNLSTSKNTSISLMAFDKGQGLTPHRAPGEALLTILEGSCILGYENKEYILKAGESFGFKKNGLHSLKADERFKMMLILEKE